MSSARAHLEELAPRESSSADGLPVRDILGIPIAMTDYDGAMDVMDRMVESREPGYVIAAAVHVVMVGQEDPEVRDALLGSMPDAAGRDAGRLGGQLARREPARPRLRARAHAPLQRSLRRAGAPRLALRGPRRGLARAARPLDAPQAPGDPRWAATRPLPRPGEEEEDAIVEQINEARPDVLWVGIGVPKQEKWMARMRDRLEVPVMCGVVPRSTSTPAASPRPPTGCRSAASSGPTGSPRSRAGCCRATSTTTRASLAAIAGQVTRERGGRS